MSKKNDFGRLTALLDGGSIKNRNLQIILDKTFPKRIFTIHCGYGVDNTAAGAVFVAGRLIVFSGNYDRHAIEQIDPLSALLPSNIPSSVIFDQIITNKTEKFNFGEYGLIYKGEEPLNILLTAPITDGDAFPSFDVMNGFLNVTGIYENPKVENPIGTLRYP